MRSKVVLSVLAAAIITFVFTALPTAASAASYPGNKCVSSKLKAASTKCRALLKAWSGWDTSQDAVKRDEALATAATKFTSAWDKADEKASAKGVACDDTTLSRA